MPAILIVDDEDSNREVIEAYLDGEGYTILHASSGEEAIAVAKASQPDLVLLDVMMPGMNGFAAASRLKEQASPAYLPIILVSGLTDQSSRLLGLGTSGDEFLTKPVDGTELLIRVRNLLALRSQGAELLRRNTEHVELHRFKDELSSMIVHDLKSPLAAVLANVDYLLGDAAKLEQAHIEALEDAKSAGHRALNIIHNLLDVTAIEGKRIALRRKRIVFADMVSAILKPRSAGFRDRNVVVTTRIQDGLVVEADDDVLGRVLENILDNALRYTPPGGAMLIAAETTDNETTVRIGNSGKAVEPSFRTQIFEKFAQASPNAGRMNLGLGLYFCRLAVEAHAGRIWVEETELLPTVFAIALPAVAAG